MNKTNSKKHTNGKSNNIKNGKKQKPSTPSKITNEIINKLNGNTKTNELSTTELIKDENVWAAIYSFFENRYMSQHLLDGFNHFLSIDIQEVIDHFSTIKVHVPNSDPEVPGEYYTIRFGEFIINRPSFVEENNEIRYITPNECSLRDISYASEMYIDVTTIPHNGKSSTYKKVHFGTLPMMVLSKMCNLSGIKHNKYEMARKGECIYEQGGYYIMGGTKKFLVPQERSIYNTVYVYANKKKKPKYQLYSQIRSNSLGGFHSTEATVGIIGRKITAIIPWIEKDPVPIGVLYFALGATNYEDIARSIVGSNINDKEVLTLLSENLEYSYQYNTQEKALHYIGLQGKKFSKKVKTETDEYDENEEFNDINEYGDNEDEREEFQKKREGDAISYARHLLANEYLPHVGTSFEKKVEFLGYMVQELIYTFLSRRKLDDRDHYMNKTIANVDILLKAQFHSAFKKFTKDIELLTKKAIQDKTSINIIAWITPKIIKTSMFSAIVTNGWNSKNAGWQAISQVLEQYNYMGMLSCLRKLCVPMGKDTDKVIAPRNLHPGSFGVACPSATPEGKRCGTVKNLALTGMITIGYDHEDLRPILMNILKSYAIISNNINYQIRVFLNGEIIAYIINPESFVYQLRQLRRSGSLHCETSIAYLEDKKQIRISTNPGRPCRPLFIVENGKLVMTQKDLDLLIQKKIDWDYLLLNGIVEIIDKVEEEYMLLIGFPSDLKNMNNEKLHRITHCELHPSMMMGVEGSIIQFPDHNQSPRNCYQCIEENELVLMANGSRKPIKLIKVGDKVVSVNTINLTRHVSIVQKVQHTITNKMVYKIKTLNGKEIIATGDHKFLVYPLDRIKSGVKNNNFMWKTVQNLLGSDRLIMFETNLKTDNGTVSNRQYENVEIKSIELVKNNRVVDITVDSKYESFIAGDGFCVHNCSMAKQSCGLSFLNFRNNRGDFNVLQYLQKPLSMTRASYITKFHLMPAGQLAKVLIMPFEFNQEDAIEINKSSINRGFMVITKFLEFTSNISDRCILGILPTNENKDTFGYSEVEIIRGKGNPKNLDSDGLPAVGDIYEEGDIVIGKYIEIIEDKDKSLNNQYHKRKIIYKDESIIYPHKTKGVVDSVKISSNGDGYKFVTVMIAQKRIPENADKFAAMPGQKGVMGMSYRDVDLPFDKYGVNPDIIINSLAFPSRMTIGTLIECLTGKIIETSKPGGCNEKTLGDIFHPKNHGDSTPFMKSFDIMKLTKELHENGYGSYGDEQLYCGITGEPLQCLSFVGPMYYQRLKHMVGDKYHARARGGRTTLTNQPKDGRALGGGFRVGEMEAWSIIAAGACYFLKDRLMDQSDEFDIWVCDICGLISVSNKDNNAAECRVCQTNKCSHVKIPFGAKLIIQELITLNIVPRILVSKRYDGENNIRIEKTSEPEMQVMSDKVLYKV
jgi:DNA-directed RNA polymerase beta subunit